MNPYVQKTTHSSHTAGTKLPSKTIVESKTDKGKFNSNRKITPSRTPDRLLINDYSINKTPSIKRISDRIPQPNFHNFNSKVPPLKMHHVDKNRFSEKRLIDKSFDNIVHTQNSKHDRSFSNPRPKKRTTSNNSKIIEAPLGNRYLQPISNNRLQNLNSLDKFTSNTTSNKTTLNVPPSDLAYHSSLNNTRKNSLAQVNVNTTISPTDMVSSTFMTSLGSGGRANTFLTEQTTESETLKATNKPKIMLRPLVESRFQEKLMKAYQMPKNYLLGALPSSSSKFAGYRRSRMQHQNSKDRNLSFSHKNDNYSMSKGNFYHPLKCTELILPHDFTENRKQVDTSVDHDYSQITHRTAKSEKKMLTKRRNSFTNMSLLDAVRPAFETNRPNNSFSIGKLIEEKLLLIMFPHVR